MVLRPLAVLWHGHCHAHISNHADFDTLNVEANALHDQDAAHTTRVKEDTESAQGRQNQHD